MFTFYVFDQKYPFWENLVQEFKTLGPKSNLILKLEYAESISGVHFVFI